MVDAGCPGEMSSANHQSLHARLDDDQRPSSPNSIVKNSQRTSASTEASSSLEPISTMKKKMWSSMYMLEEIPDDSILLTLAHITNAFASGAIDVASFHAWENFTCMQTGNSVFTVLRATLPNAFPGSWLDPLISILSFIIGSICFGALMRALSKQRRANRLALVTSQGIQASILLLVAILCYSDILPHARLPRDRLNVIQGGKFVAIILLGLQASGQLVASREIGRPELPTVVLTASYVDLFADRGLLRKHNPRRNGLVGQVICIFLGFFFGSKMSEHPNQMPIVLFVGFAVKFVICIVWACLPGEQVDVLQGDVEQRSVKEKANV